MFDALTKNYLIVSAYKSSEDNLFVLSNILAYSHPMLQSKWKS